MLWFKGLMVVCFLVTGIHVWDVIKRPATDKAESNVDVALFSICTFIEVAGIIAITT